MQRDDSEREVERQERLKERANRGTATGRSRKGIDTRGLEGDRRGERTAGIDGSESQITQEDFRRRKWKKNHDCESGDQNGHIRYTHIYTYTYTYIHTYRHRIEHGPGWRYRKSSFRDRAT